MFFTNTTFCIDIFLNFAENNREVANCKSSECQKIE